MVYDVVGLMVTVVKGLVVGVVMKVEIKCVLMTCLHSCP